MRQRRPRFGRRPRHAGQHQHLLGERVGDFHRIGRAATFEALDGFGDFERVADGATERLLHRGENRARGFAHRGRHRDECLREFTRLRFFFHERAAAEFHVEHEYVDALGEFFREDAAADQRDALDGRRHVAQRIKFFVGGRQFRRLADEREPDGFQLRAVFRHREVHAETGNRFEFIECAAGVTEASTGNHRHGDAAGRDHRREVERNFITHATGRVFVGLRIFHAREIGDDAGVHHRFGVERGFRGRHAAQVNRHEQRRELIIRPRAIGGAPHKRRDLVATQRQAVAFFGDDMLGKQHGFSPNAPRAKGNRAATRAKTGFSLARSEPRVE